MTDPNTLSTAHNVAVAQSVRDAVLMGQLPGPTDVVYSRHGLTVDHLLRLADHYEVPVILYDEATTRGGYRFASIKIPLYQGEKLTADYKLFGGNGMTDGEWAICESHNANCLIDPDMPHATRPSILNHRPATAGSDLPHRDEGVTDTNAYAPEHAG